MDWPDSRSMRATVGSATLHFTRESLMTFPWASRKVAKNPALSRTATVSPDGVTVTDATGPGLPGGVESTDESPASVGDRRRFGPVSSLQAAVIATAAMKAASFCRIVPPVRSERRRKWIPTDARRASHLESACLLAPHTVGPYVARMSVQAIAWSASGAVRIVDQRALPDARIERDLESGEAVADAIRTLQVRGAPLIGIAGALATGGIGTALAPIYLAHAAGRRVEVFVDETRPVLQGARLTAWELVRAGIPCTVIADAAAGWLMRQAQVDLVIVGADRIAANGDFANKIGTYSLAVLALHHGVPFYCAAPSSTIDVALADGGGIPIEQRAADEVKSLAGRAIAPAEAGALNPAFDVTPARYVTAFITDRGVEHPPFRDGAPSGSGGV